MNHTYLNCAISGEDFINTYNILNNDIQHILQTKITSVESDRIIWLKSRSWWSTIYDDFQSIVNNLFPNTHIVGVPENDAMYTILKIDTIHLPNDNTIYTKMTQSACHDNCIELYLNNRSMSNRIFTGFALSTDGLWRYHSWIVSENDVITETTGPRLIYIGHDCSSDYDELLNIDKRDKPDEIVVESSNSEEHFDLNLIK